MPASSQTGFIARQIRKWGKKAQVAVRERIALPGVVLPEGGPGQYPVVVYFSDDESYAYQLRQWVPVLDRLAQNVDVLLVMRDYEYFTKLAALGKIRTAFAYSAGDLLRLYGNANVKVILYPNNGWRNFQSLIYQAALHVHINHGESDKFSMASNQAKAYDRVVVAGLAAIDRYRSTLLEFPESKFVPCGRPQLDLDISPGLRQIEGVRTVLYAPTWSAGTEENNYTSLSSYGLAIVDCVLGMANTRLVYKPHPRIVVGDPDPEVARAHKSIMAAIGRANTGGPARHLTPLNSDILSVFDVDLMVTDVSSVGLDFLYLRSNVPLILTDRRTDRDRLRRESPIARAVDIIDATTLSDLTGIVLRNLASDARRKEREQIRDYYFGFPRGESTMRFQSLVTDLVDTRDRLFAERR